MRAGKFILIIGTSIIGLMLYSQISSAQMREITDYEMDAIVGKAGFSVAYHGDNSRLLEMVENMSNNLSDDESPLDNITRKIILIKTLKAYSTKRCNTKMIAIIVERLLQ